MSRRMLGIAVGVALLAVGASGAYWYTSGRATNTELHPTAANPTHLSLPVPEQEYLWALEHRHNVLQEFGFRTICEAVRDADQARLERQLAPSFTAEIFQQPDEVSVRTDAVSILRQKKAKSADRKLDKQAFIAWLFEHRQRFGKPPKAKFDVMLVKPPAHDQFEGVWNVSSVFRLWGEAASGGPLEITARIRLQVEQPTKERLAEPGWLLGCSVEQVAVVQSTHLLFGDVAAQRGVQAQVFHDNWQDEAKLINTGAVYACDYNRDGCVDLLITDLKTGRFYQGQPDGRLKDVTTEVGLYGRISGSSARVAIVDFDNDGWEDIVAPNAVYRNDQGRRFEDWTRRTNLLGLVSGQENLTGLIPGDFDRDGLIDLYAIRSQRPIGSWLEDRTLNGVKNQLLRNKGGGQFEDVTDATQTDGGGLSVFTAVWLDYNQDDWPDLYVINEFGNGLLLENREGRTFQPRQIANGPIDFGSMGLSAGDLNNDGAIDLYLSNMYSKAGSRVIGNLSPGHYSDAVMARIKSLVAGSELYLNRGTAGFQPLGKPYQVNGVGWSWGSAMADLDNDGWLDLYVTAGFMSRDRSKPDG